LNELATKTKYCPRKRGRSKLATGVKAAVVFVDYERSPDQRYPVAIEQSYAVTDYVSKHPKEFNVDASRMAIAGDRRSP